MFKKSIVFCLFTLCVSGDKKLYEYFDLPEGANCSLNGPNGKCTSIQNCPSAKEAIQQRQHPPICSFQGPKPIVCCATCSPNDKDPFKNFALGSRFNQRSKARDNCIRYLKTLGYPCGFIVDRSPEENCIEETPTASGLRSSSLERSAGKVKRHAQKKTNFFIDFNPADNAPQVSHGEEAYRNQYPHMLRSEDFVTARSFVTGGKPAFREQYPHMALLGFGDDVKTAQWLCGGSVISENYILTAAHCQSSPSVGPVKFVALGILKRSDPPELWQTHNVKRVIPHPEYKPPSKYNDIALLETETKIRFSNDVLPACLHLVPEAAETAEATGWGSTGHRQGLADVLQTVKLQRYDQEKCSQLYPVHRHLSKGYDHSSQMCYGDTEVPKDTCEGDSGGPLQVRNEVLSCAYTVVGVTSYGRQCGISAGSGMYTRVYHYVPWIESIVWP